VPLRDAATHTLLSGVEIGDVGDKIGRQGVDNGWIRFTNVRVPRDHMLMRFAYLTPQGEYTKFGQPQLAYSALIGGKHPLFSPLSLSFWVYTVILSFDCF
jgi:acyl-CoA oxidase